jgi:hypothetical protein
MPTDKIRITIGRAYEDFLKNLEKPMKLNEMRIMKEPNYSKLREVLRDPKLYGNHVLRHIAENCESLGISFNSYHMIHEGFWDLYCKKPATVDLNAKKLEGWINNINLQTSI